MNITSHRQSVARRHHGLKALLGVSAALVVGGLQVRTASACTVDAGPPPECHRASFAIPEDSTVPSNILGVPVFPGIATGFELRSPDGTVIPTSVLVTPTNESVLRPASGLAPSTRYTVRYDEFCTPSRTRSETSERLEFSFNTGTASPQPTSIGTLQATMENGYANYPALNSCGAPVPVWSSIANIRLNASAEMQAYLPLARFSLEIERPDGSATPIGTLGPGNPNDRLEIGSAAVACVPSTTAVTGTVNPGRRTVRVYAQIYGNDVRSLVGSTEVDFACTPEPASHIGPPTMRCEVGGSPGRAGRMGWIGFVALAGVWASRRLRRGGR